MKFDAIMFLSTLPVKCKKNHFFSNNLSSIFSAATGQVVIARNRIYFFVLQCFDAAGWAAGRASGL